MLVPKPKSQNNCVFGSYLQSHCFTSGMSFLEISDVELLRTVGKITIRVVIIKEYSNG